MRRFPNRLIPIKPHSSPQGAKEDQEKLSEADVPQVCDVIQCPQCHGFHVEPLPPYLLLSGFLGFAVALICGYLGGLAYGSIVVIGGAILLFWLTPRVPKWHCSICDYKWSVGPRPQIEPQLEARWSHFDRLGPSAVRPLRSQYIPVARYPERGIYAAIFDSRDFRDLTDFVVFHWVNGSIMQSLIKNGSPDPESYVRLDPPSELPRLQRWFEFYPEKSGPIPMGDLLENVLGDRAIVWPAELVLDAGFVVNISGELEVSGVCRQGYVIVFLGDEV